MKEKPIDKIKKIVKESKDSEECGKKLIEEKLSISMSQGRRYWHCLKDKK